MSLEVIEVDQFRGEQSHQSHQGHGPPTAELAATSLQDARSMVGAILVPSFLPDGYALAAAAVFRGRDVFLTYVDGSTTGGPLFVNLVRKAKPKVKSGHVKRVSIGRRKGHLIYGTWEKSNNTIAWNRDTALTLAFERDGWVVVITGLDGFDDRTLSRIGESLKL